HSMIRQKSKKKNRYKIHCVNYHMRSIVLPIAIVLILVSSCTENRKKYSPSFIAVANGEMPAITSENSNSLHMVFGKGDSILYTNLDKAGNSFAPPVLVDTLHDLVAYATRGPQISATKNGLVIIAVNKAGNIYSYLKDATGNWTKTGKVNDVDTTDKEGFLGLSGDGGNNLFAIWPDLRKDKHNKLFGARSTDGGKTWNKNILVYASPDGNICECCKPSVVMQGQHVMVMFRNWLRGNRNLYLIQSIDGGESFGKATKLGIGSWTLDGCPMDGGGLAVSKEGTIQTAWRRKSTIYACEPGQPEKDLGEGKNCTVETVNHQNIYAWTNKGNITCLLPGGSQKVIGKGMLPVLKSLNDKEVICVWENDKQIEAYILHL
ncbi:MAG: sialidase family protein, partial [Ginsengibacter sp.]